MDDQLLLDTVRSLETEVAVSASVAARALGTTEAVLQPYIDRLVKCAALRSSEVRCRPHPGADFALHRVWYHTPKCEVAARFGHDSEQPDSEQPGSKQRDSKQRDSKQRDTGRLLVRSTPDALSA